MKKNVIIASLIGLIVINVVADYYETKVQKNLDIEENNLDNEIKKAEESKLINPLVNQLFTNYVKYWSDQDFNKISDEIYGLPFILYDQDETIVFSSKSTPGIDTGSDPVLIIIFSLSIFVSELSELEILI